MKNIRIKICIILFVIFFAFIISGAATDNKPSDITADYHEMTLEMEELLQSAVSNIKNEKYFPFGWQQSNETEYIFLCKAKHINPEKFYFALLTIDFAEEATPLLKDAVQIAESFEEAYIAAYEKVRPVKSLDEYSRMEILENESLLTEYRETHPYLDDLHLWDIPDDGLLSQIGYSYIWNVLSIVYREDDHEELYADVSSDVFNFFMQCPDKAAFFYPNIRDKYQSIQLPEPQDLTEYVTVIENP